MRHRYKKELRDKFSDEDIENSVLNSKNYVEAALLLTSHGHGKINRHQARSWYKAIERREEEPYDTPTTCNRRTQPTSRSSAVENKTMDKPIAGGIVSDPNDLRSSFTGRRYVFTSAQNNTVVHGKLLDALENFCHHNDAELVVGTFTYNKNGFQNDTKEDDGLWYDPRIVPYIVNSSKAVASSLVWCGELNILPTAANPLSGMHNYTQDKASIFPHVKVRMESVPTMKHKRPKFMYTTGCITQRNYIQKKAGQKASFHHTFGALYVEIAEDGEWFARQLISDKSGVFHDLEMRYNSEGCHPCPVVAINWGDLHVEKMDHTVASHAMGISKYYDDWWEDVHQPHNMLDSLNPQFQLLHDTTDFMPRNHHNRGDHHFMFERHVQDDGSVENALRETASFVEALTGRGSLVVVVSSNHDGAFKQWLKEADYRNDPQNALFFLDRQMRVYEAIKDRTEGFDIFEDTLVQMEPKLAEQALFLREDQSFPIMGIECGMHGHLGANGARGAPNQFAKMGTKSNTGHTHSAGIIDGCFTAGVSGSLDMGYNKGLSSWSHSHIVTYANGKRAIITQAPDGRWRA